MVAPSVISPLSVTMSFSADVPHWRPESTHACLLFTQECELSRWVRKGLEPGSRGGAWAGSGARLQGPWVWPPPGAPACPACCVHFTFQVQNAFLLS